MESSKTISKRCSKCRKIKSSDAFNKANTKSGGLQPRCKTCISKYTKKGYQTIAMTMTTRKRYQSDWTQFFAQEYGANPRCGICDTALSYSQDKDLPTVAFDHRHGDSSMINRPAAFCRTHPCNETHRATWRACDFGILCRRCNSAIPTKDRLQWFRKIARYVGAA